GALPDVVGGRCCAEGGGGPLPPRGKPPRGGRPRPPPPSPPHSPPPRPPPPRLNRRKRHLLPDIIAIAICAVICGANNFPQVEAFGNRRRDWLARFLALPNGIPSHDTFERAFQRLCPHAFQRCFLAWLRQLHAQVGGEPFP